MTAGAQAGPRPIGNRAFLLGIGSASIALLLSGLALFVAYSLGAPELQSYRAATEGREITPRTYPGDSFVIRLGAGAGTSEDAIALVQLSPDERGIITVRARFDAADYPFVRVDLQNYHPRQYAYLIWRRADDPETVHNAMLYWDADKPVVHFAAKDPEWRGTITEIGLDIYGSLRDAPFQLNSLSLEPASRSVIREAVWSEWTVLRGWTQKSAHHLLGTPKDPLLSPTVAIAAWAGLALLLLLLAALVTRRHQPVAYGAAVLLPWIILDLLWQRELNQNLTEAHYLYAGKNQHEKHMAERDANLYAYAQRLKGEVLPQPGARIFLLHNDEHRTYSRLKFQYYLLPHNLYNYDRYPQAAHTVAGDLILVLGDVPGLTYTENDHRLSWHQQSLPVTVVDQDPEGTLYRVTGGATP